MRSKNTVFSLLAIGTLALVFASLYELRRQATIAAPIQPESASAIDPTMPSLPPMPEQSPAAAEITPPSTPLPADAMMQEEPEGQALQPFPPEMTELIPSMPEGMTPPKAEDVASARARAAAMAEGYRKQAEAGDAAAMGKLGAAYHNGIGVEHDLNKAFYWFRKGGAKGDETSATYLGRYYAGFFPELGISQDLDKAEKWLRKPAMNGNGVAMSLLSVVLEAKVKNGETDRKQEAEWWAAKGSGRPYDKSYTPADMPQDESAGAMDAPAETE